MSIAEIESTELAVNAPTGGLWREAWQRLRRNPGAIVGSIFVLTFIVVGIFAPLIARYSPTEVDFNHLPLSCCPGPSSRYWFGQDEVGHDVYSRVVYGARLSLIVGVISVCVGLSVGFVLGAIAGYVGGIVDTGIMRLMDVMLAIPGLLLAIGIVALELPIPRIYQIMIAVGVTNIPIFARLLRGSILAQRENDFVLAARAVGVRRPTILFGHILPNAISPVIVQATLALATAIIDVAALGFLGLGPEDPATPEWGNMLASAQDYLSAQPLLAIFPGVAIVITVLGFNLIGDALREALDPKLRGRV